MDEARQWRGFDSALTTGAAVIVACGALVLEWSVFIVNALSQVPVRRFVISQEDDARRP